MRKEIFRKCILMLGSTVAALFIGEVGLRILGYKFTGSTYIADPVLGWGLRPGAGAWEADEGTAWSKINRHGFRDKERDFNKSPDTFRIAVLGDSMTEARQVDMDKTFTALSELELIRQHCFVGSNKVEVLNFGVGGYGTAQELLQLRNRVWKYSPDLVVLQFYAGNDVFNNSRLLNVSSPELAPYFRLSNGKLELDDRFRQEQALNPSRIKIKAFAADVLNRSVLLQMLYKVRLIQQQRAEMKRLESAGPQGLSGSGTLPANYQRFAIFLPPTVPAIEEAWQVTEALLTEMGKEVHSHGVPFLLMLMPAGIQFEIDPKLQEEFCRTYNITSLDYADDRLEAHARSNGIPVLRVTRALVEEARRTGTYMAGFHNTERNVGHLNQQGHQVIARELTRALCDVARQNVKNKMIQAGN